MHACKLISMHGVKTVHPWPLPSPPNDEISSPFTSELYDLFYTICGTSLYSYEVNKYWKVQWTKAENVKPKHSIWVLITTYYLIQYLSLPFWFCLSPSLCISVYQSPCLLVYQFLCLCTLFISLFLCLDVLQSIWLSLSSFHNELQILAN